MFHYGGATFHEISRVDIYKPIDLLNFSMMYMPAYNAIQTLVFKRTDDAFFIIGDKLNHIFTKLKMLTEANESYVTSWQNAHHQACAGKPKSSKKIQGKKFVEIGSLR